MKGRTEVIFAACGIVFTLGLLIGWGLLSGHILPPTLPSALADEVAVKYQSSPLRIQIGMAITLATVGFLVPFGSALATQMRRMGEGGETLARTQMGCAVLSAGVITMGMTLFAITSFRPDRDPQLTLLLSDMAWIAFTMPVCGIMLWMIVTGWAILSDRSPRPVFPRWSGYFCFFGATLSVPGYPVALFKHGAFAWNGLLAFWVALLIAFAWILLMSGLTIRAVRQDTDLQQQSH